MIDIAFLEYFLQGMSSFSEFSPRPIQSFE